MIAKKGRKEGGTKITFSVIIRKVLTIKDCVRKLTALRHAQNPENVEENATPAKVPGVEPT